jgi:hypothetical protein
MSTQPRPKERVTLSKTAKRRAGTIVDKAERRSYIRSQLDAENAAYLARFAKLGKDRSDSN